MDNRVRLFTSVQIKTNTHLLYHYVLLCFVHTHKFGMSTLKFVVVVLWLCTFKRHWKTTNCCIPYGHQRETFICLSMEQRQSVALIFLCEMFPHLKRVPHYYLWIIHAFFIEEIKRSRLKYHLYPFIKPKQPVFLLGKAERIASDLLIKPVCCVSVGEGEKILLNLFMFSNL